MDNINTAVEVALYFIGSALGCWGIWRKVKPRKKSKLVDRLLKKE